MVDPGAILGGRYRVGRTLGKGGMGVVVEALHVQLGTRVAVKVLKGDLAEQPHLVERFLREARAAAQLRGEHVCRVHDFGTLDDGAPFMVMEMLEGHDLASVLKQTGVIAPEVVASYMIQACAGLAEAHALGMVHRDLKPGNLFLAQRTDGSPAIKVLDFGIAKLTGPVDFSLTDTSNVMGSPAYMSPEQLKSSKNVDARSDIWSLGISMYELVMKSQPFQGESITALTLSIASEPPLPFPATVPVAFAEVVFRCLEKDPAKRFADVGELAAALAPCTSTQTSPLATSVASVLTRTSRSHEVIATPADDPSEKVTTLQAATGTVEAPVPRRRTGMIAALAAGALAVGGLVLYAGVFRNGDADDGSRASAPPAASTPSAASTSPATATPPAASTPPAGLTPSAASTPPSSGANAASTPPAPAGTTTPAASTLPAPAGATSPAASTSPAPGATGSEVAPTTASGATASTAAKKKTAKPPKKVVKPTKPGPKGVKPPPEDLGKSRY